MIKTLTYKSYSVYLTAGKYSNGRMAVKLIDANDGCPITTATINIPEVELNKNEILIKDYSENENMLDFLIKNGFVSNPVRYIRSGYVTVPVVERLPKLMEWL